MDYLILCFPGQYIRELDFEKEENLINFISNNKNKYRFTIFTDCDKGYNYKGISVSPYWKWRTCNRYHNCLIYLDSSHLKLNINAKNLIYYNKYNFNTPEMTKATKIVTELEPFEELMC